MLLQDYLSDWLILRSSALKPRTIESYAYVIRHISAQIGSISVDQVSAYDITHALAQIALRHTRTAEMAYVLLADALSDLPSDPMRHVKRPKHIQHSPQAWSDEDIARYVAALADHPHRLPLLCAIALGMRRGEICGLRWTDIDFAASTIHICNQRVRLETGAIIDCTPKSASSDRVIPVPASLMRLFRADRQLSGYICPLTPSGLDSAHRKLVQSLGLPHIPLHGLRHSFATSCVRHGGSMKGLQLLLGHSSYATTANRYTHPDMQMLRESMDKAQIV